jgi:peptide/nickel transport system ATP-binding protein
MTSTALLLEGISLTYRGRSAPALSNVSVSLEAGGSVGVVGESGSGKSSLAAVAIGFEAPQAGAVSLYGEPLASRLGRRTIAQRRAIQIVFQDPNSSLDPTWPVWRTVTEGVALQQRTGDAQLREQAELLLAEVALPPDLLDRRPHELSGGQRQRVAIARALAVDPKVLLLDEPTSALDVSVQAQVLDLLLDVQERRGLSMLLISHDLDVVRHLCTRIYVMRAGHVVESGPAEEIFAAPRQAYTQALIAAAPRIGAGR